MKTWIYFVNAAIFLFVFLGHGLRLLEGSDLFFYTWYVPMWVSAFAVGFSVYMLAIIYKGFKEQEFEYERWR